jgi:hypothetical protein
LSEIREPSTLPIFIFLRLTLLIIKTSLSNYIGLKWIATTDPHTYSCYSYHILKKCKWWHPIFLPKSSLPLHSLRLWKVLLEQKTKNYFFYRLTTTRPTSEEPEKIAIMNKIPGKLRFFFLHSPTPRIASKLECKRNLWQKICV